jgi:hypothetical protein
MTRRSKPQLRTDLAAGAAGAHHRGFRGSFQARRHVAAPRPHRVCCAEGSTPSQEQEQVAAPSSNGSAVPFSNDAQAEAEQTPAVSSPSSTAEAQAQAQAEAVPELVYKEPSASDKLWTNFKLAFALPWRRFKQDSVLVMKVSGARPGTVAPQLAQAASGAALQLGLRGTFEEHMSLLPTAGLHRTPPCFVSVCLRGEATLAPCPCFALLGALTHCLPADLPACIVCCAAGGHHF